MADEMYDEMDDVRYETHPKVVAGVVVMASVTLFCVLFTITLLALAWLSPLRFDPVLADYLSQTRVVIAALVSGVLTALFWFLVD